MLQTGESHANAQCLFIGFYPRLRKTETTGRQIVLNAEVQHAAFASQSDELASFPNREVQAYVQEETEC